MTRTRIARSRLLAATPLFLFPLAACGSNMDESISKESAAIIGGTKVPATNHGVVRLVSTKCSATLLNNQWALTANHCGSQIGDSATMNGQTRTISRVVPHPSVSLGVDVALVQLSSPMSMNGSTTGFRRLLRRSDATDGTIVSCFGYGGTSNAPGTSATLRTGQ